MAFEHQIAMALIHPFTHEWRSHGNGFIKTYLDAERTVRLNLWHSRFKMAGVSSLHTHPWRLRSQIVAGVLVNYRWTRDTAGEPFWEGIINTQNFKGIEGEPLPVRLLRGAGEVYREGAVYSQRPEEIHHTEYADGTVTVMTRTDVPENGDKASVFWPDGEEYVDATQPWHNYDLEAATSAARKHLGLPL